MKIAILHLSDIHIRSASDGVLQRALSVTAAAKAAAPSADAYLIAATGDIAYSGTTEQYDLAYIFLKRVTTELKNSGKPVFHFLIPGNHDLDLDAEPDTRPSLLETISEKLDQLDFNGETVRQLLSVQQRFFEFEARMREDSVRPPQDQLIYNEAFNVGKSVIRVHCFNTAWVSTNPEHPAQLVFPTRHMPTQAGAAELVISAFHHPYSWLTPNNAKAFRWAIENASDVVLTGHEHEQAFYAKENIGSQVVHYIEGAALQEHRDASSAFNVVVIDTESNSYEAFSSVWDGRSYGFTPVGTRLFVRNSLLHRSDFRNNMTFLQALRDPGIPIFHPHSREVMLEDLFVYPGIICKNPDKRFEVSNIVPSDGVVEYFRANPYVVIMGDDLIGKSSLAKQLLRDIQVDGEIVPILLTGSCFTGLKEKNIRKVIKDNFILQYDETSVDQWFLLERAQRLAIIDDWHSTKYNAKGRSALLEHLKTFCGRLVLLTNRVAPFDEIASSSPIWKALADFKFCEIKTFGKKLTGHLIEKWHLLGQEDSLSPSEFNYAVASSEHKISSIMGSGVLPTYPIFIIGLLQADAAPSLGNQSGGSYGHILESLITSRLVEVSRHSTDIGTMYTYTSRIAYFLFKKDRRYLSANEMRTLHNEYCDTYKMNLEESKVLSDLIEAKLLMRDGNNYVFRYKGCYWYFVGRYFAENLASNAGMLRPELNEICDRIGWEDYTNILLFFLYITRDPEIIERLLSNAAKVYSEFEPSDLTADVTFINSLLVKKLDPIVLPPTNVQENRENFRGQQDEAGDLPEDPTLMAPSQRVPYRPELDEITKVTIALQSLRIIGQVLRNFPGVFTGGPKLRLTEACYFLGLRLLRRFLNLAQENVEALRLAFAKTFKERHPMATQGEVDRSADQLLVSLCGAVAYGVIKKVGRAVGLPELEMTFDEVLERHGDKLSVRLINLAIRFEFFRDAPEAEVYELSKDVKGNNFSYKLLRDLVSEYLILYNTDSRMKQRLGKELDIDTSGPQYLLNKAVGTSLTDVEDKT